MLEKLKIIRKFIFEDIWRLRREDTTSKRQFFLIKYGKIIILAIRRFLEDDCKMKASALTYYTLLSIVPVIALLFGIASGFGFRESLQNEIDKRFENQEQILEWINSFVMGYLENAKGGYIAGVGLILLVWAVMKLFGYIERSFNNIWDVKKSRSIGRKLTDYISFMMIAVIFVIAYSGVAVFISNTIRGFSLLEAIGPALSYISVIVMVWIVFTLLFIIMPNTKVKISAAIFGAVISGTGFIILQFAYIYFQMGVSKYNAIYGSFAAIPLFLIWLQMSWLMVLFGAELAAAFQNVKSFEFESDTKNMSYFYRRLVSLSIVKFIIDKFKKNEEPPTMSEILMKLKLPVRLAAEVIYGLENAGIIMESVINNSEEKVYLPAFDINKMTVECIVRKLEDYGASDFLFEEGEDFTKLRNILSSFAKRQKDVPENLLLRDL